MFIALRLTESIILNAVCSRVASSGTVFGPIFSFKLLHTCFHPESTKPNRAWSEVGWTSVSNSQIILKASPKIIPGIFLTSNTWFANKPIITAQINIHLYTTVYRDRNKCNRYNNLHDTDTSKRRKTRQRWRKQLSFRTKVPWGPWQRPLMCSRRRCGGRRNGADTG